MSDGELAGVLECPSCDQENPVGSLFCGSCGQSLTKRPPCPECGVETAAGQAFCNHCGASLANASPDSADVPSEPGRGLNLPEPPSALARKIADAAPRLEGERKQVTILFADVMGSMDLAEGTDPERWRAIMDGFYGVLADAVHTFEGMVDKFTGDGIMAIFGAPIAHEDHAQRACYAVLDMQEAVAEYAAELRRRDGISLAARFGINSGEVVVGSIGEGGSMSYTALGHTVGLAQRMESLAEPGKAYLTDSSARLAAGFLELHDLGEFDVKGASKPIRVHELVGVGSARRRIDVAQARGFSRFVGRETEMAELDAALERAVAGEGAVVGIVAEAGVGKSRLCHELTERCRARGISVYEAQCQAHGRSLPLMPVLQMLRAYFGIEPGDSERIVRERIAGRLLLLDHAFEADLPLIFDLLGAPDPERPSPQMTPEARQRRLLGAVNGLVRARSRDETVVNVVEDLHWIDPSSEVFLAALIDAVPGTSSLVIANYRPEYRPEWMRRSHCKQLPLTPLGPEALREMLAELLGSDPSLDGLAELIRDRTGGNPFFVEESVRELAESGVLVGETGGYRLVRQVDEIAVPATVHAVLAARIDRLTAESKLALQAGATIGKEFRRDLLRLSVDLGEDEVDTALGDLVAGDFVDQTAVYPEPEYAFRHPLTREVAYGSQLDATRAASHGAVARGLIEVESDRLDESAALIAQHFEQAGEAMDAVQWHLRAAAWAGVKDPSAAFQHCQRIRDLDAELPDGPEADGVRLAARLMMLVTGWRLGADLTVSRQVCQEGGAIAERQNDPGSLAILHGALGIAEATCGGDVPAYVEHAQKALRFGVEVQDPNLRVAVASAPYYAFFLGGRQEEALASLDRVLELTADDHQLGSGIIIVNPHAWATTFRSGPLMLLGRVAEARRALEAGTELCRRADDRESLGWAHGFHVNLYLLGGDPPGPVTVAHGRAAVEIAEAIGDGFSNVLAYNWLGGAELLTGDPAQAERTLDHSLETMERRGVGLETEPWARMNRGMAIDALGRRGEAVNELERAVSLCEERGVKVWAPNVITRLAQVLVERAHSGDFARAAELLGQAESLGLELGARPDVARALLVRARLELRVGEVERSARTRSEGQALATEIDARGLVAEFAAEDAPVG